jgi:hypothetical protein
MVAHPAMHAPGSKSSHNLPGTRITDEPINSVATEPMAALPIHRPLVPCNTIVLPVSLHLPFRMS